MTTEKICIENPHPQVTQISLNRPEINNAFDDQMITTFTEHLQQIDKDPNIRVVLIAAKGKNFSAGADIHWMKSMAQYSPEENLQDALRLAKLMQTLDSLSKPTIALVQGAAFGGAVGLVACCDIAIASHDASFCFSEVKIGLIPAVISPYIVNTIGAKAARRYFLSAEKITADVALQLGLVNTLVNQTELSEAGLTLAQTLLKNSPAAMSAVKLLLQDIQHEKFDENLSQITAQYIADIRTTKEGQEGLQAFLEKRKPKWWFT